MSIAVELPALGESVLEGTVSRWLVQEGDTVLVDQPLVEVTTDKVDAEIPSPADGVVEKILVAEGETVEVGAQLVTISTGPAAAAAASRSESPRRDTAGDAAGEAPGAGTAARESRAPSDDGPRATPVARRIAEGADVDLASVAGTGP